MNTLLIVAWCLVLAASIAGLALKDVRLHAATLAIAEQEMNTLLIVAWCLVLAASIAGLALKDVRLHAATLAIAVVAVVLILVHRVP